MRSRYDSTQFGNQQATTAPASVPSARRPRAIARLRSAASPQVRDRRPSASAGHRRRLRAWRSQYSAKEASSLAIGRDAEGLEDVTVAHTGQLGGQLADDAHRVRDREPDADR